MILVIDRAKRNSTYVADIFFHMGVLSKAATVSEAFSEISDSYRAVLILSPESLPDPADFIKRIRSYNLQIPIFAIGASDESYAGLLSEIYPEDTFIATVLAGIIDYTGKSNLPQPGEYKLAGIDISCDLAIPAYFWTELPFTKTESMILRYLIRTYPRPVAADEILKYAFRESKTPELANIRTHISVINKKFRELTTRNLIETSFGKGYRVLTPEVMAALV